MTNLVSLYNVCAVVAAERDVEELVVFAQIPETRADVRLEVVPAEILIKSLKFFTKFRKWKTLKIVQICLNKMGRIRSSKIRSWIRIQNISFRIHNTAILYIFSCF